MKISLVVVSAVILSCLVNDGNCGVISDVYGNVRNKTVAFKDGVSSWLSYGKDLLIGHDETEKQEGRSGGEIVPRDGLFNDIYARVVNNFKVARDKVHSLFKSDEKKENNGFIRNMYDRVKNRITKITAYVIGEEKDKPKLNNDLSEIRRTLNVLINNKKIKLNQTLHEGVEGLKEKVKEADTEIHSGVDKVKDSVNDVTKLAKDHVTEGVNSASELINKSVGETKDGMSFITNNWQESGVEITDKEREILDALTRRLRSKMGEGKEAVTAEFKALA